MTTILDRSVERVKNILLASGAVVALASALLIGVSFPSAIRAQSRTRNVSWPEDKPLTFEAASIKPNNSAGGRGGGGGGGGDDRLHFTPGRPIGRGVELWTIVLETYHLKPYQLSGAPTWLADRFDVEGKAVGSASEAQLRLMLQTLLADRCKLAVHHETKEMPVYALIVAKSGLKLHEFKKGDPTPDLSPGSTLSLTMTVSEFVDQISFGPIGERLIGRPVLDKTGLQGVYIFQLSWGPDEDFIHAVQDQCGLRFESQKAPVDIVVIDHIQKPEAN